jgi:hypothetical protein
VMPRDRRTCVYLSVAAFACVALAESATAASVQVELQPGEGGPIAAVSYLAGPGEYNNVSAWVEGPVTRPTAYLLGDRLMVPGVPFPATLAGPGCQVVSSVPGAPTVIRCPIPAEARGSTLSIRLGDGVDRFNVTSDRTTVLDASVFGGLGPDSLHGASRMYGGPATDELMPGTYMGSYETPRGPVVLRGGPGADYLEGGQAADSIDPGPGLDELKGRGGDDQILVRDGTTDELLECGAGRDRIVLDKYDVPAGTGCETVQRNGLPRTLLLHPYFLNDSPVTTEVACPSDMPRTCHAALTLSTVAGRPLARQAMRIEAGATKLARFRYNPALNSKEAGRVSVLTTRPHGRPLRYARTQYFLSETE